MGKKKKTNKRGGSRFMRWIRSDLPDVEDNKSPVLLLGVTKISDSPSLSRRRPSDSSQYSGTGSGRYYRPPKSKYTRGHHGDARLEKIRQDLLTHKTNNPEHYIPEPLPVQQDKEVARRHKPNCLTLNCVGACKDCECDRSIRSSSRGSFLFHRPENRQSSLCPSEPYELSTQGTSHQHHSEIQHRFTEHNLASHTDKHDSGNQRKNSQFYSVTPRSNERRSLLLSNLNERFRKTLSLDSRKAERAPLSLPQSSPRPKSLVNDNACSRSDDTRLDPAQSSQTKKKRFRPRSFFSLETFFDSKRSDSSVDDYCSSKYKKFELESDDSPVFRDRPDLSKLKDDNTPDLLDLPFILDSARRSHSATRRHLEKVENYYKFVGKTVVDALPQDATDSAVRGNSSQDDDDVEYIEPIRSNFTSQSTLIIDSKSLEIPSPSKPDAALSIHTYETDIRLPSSTNSPRVEDVDSIGQFEIEVREADLLCQRTRDLIVKIMDKSVDSIGSCSLDVDASTEFSDTTSGSLNLLTPSSTTSRVRDFTARLHERTVAAPPAVHPDNLRPPKFTIDTASHRSRSKKIEHKKPSYLNLACSVNGYTNLTTYDSKLRQNINKSREASPIRPITHQYYRGDASQALLVPVPVSADKLIVPTFQPHDTNKNLTERAPSKAHTDPHLAQPMAAENRQLKSDFFGKMTRADGEMYSGMLHSKTNDEVDNIITKQMTFKSSYSETNIKNNTSKTEQYSESYTIHSNGHKQVEITKENGEKLTSPMKSFIQQRVERLYGPGALAQGFFNQKRYKKTQADENGTKVLAEKSINCISGDRLYSYTRTSNIEENTENVDLTSPNGSPSLPVLRHLRPEFRAQLPILSPKKSPGKTDTAVPNGMVQRLNMTSPKKRDEVNSDNANIVINSVVNDVHRIKLADEHSESKLNGAPETNDGLNGSKTEMTVNGAVCIVNGSESKVNGSESNVNGTSEVHDAYYFLDLEKRETERLIQMAAAAEVELEALQKTGSVSEETLGLLRAAAGKARLLATQKMQQFQGLCYNNINSRAGEQFPTTLQDLQGFWDMVCLQIRNVERLFEELTELRDNQWREVSPDPVVASPAAVPRARPPRHSAPAALRNDKARHAAQKREQDRKAMLEHRRRMVREKQLAAKSPGGADGAQNITDGDQEVEIFVGSANKSPATS